jgi:hypothetical protein
MGAERAVIICKECGNHNRDQDTFCSSCGTFLEWSGERVVEPPPPPPPEPAPPPPPGLVERVKQAVGIDSGEAAPARPAPGPAPGGGWVPPASVAARTDGAPASAPSGSAEAAPEAPPAAPPPAAVPAPEAVPPTAQRPRPPRRPPITAPPPAAESGVTCRECGAGNDVRRHFCRRCGAVLAAPAPRRLPWWRRLLARRPAAAAPSAAPPGPTAWRLLRTFVLTMLAAMLAVGVLGYAVSPGLRRTVDLRVARTVTDVRRLAHPTYADVRPASAVASSQLSEHPGQFANDLVSNDYWAADRARDPQPTLVFTFASPSDLDYVLVTSGVPNDHGRLARPKTVDLTYSDGTGEQLTLKDDARPTGYVVHARQVRSVTMRVTSVYPAPGTTALAVGEVEFFQLS